MHCAVLDHPLGKMQGPQGAAMHLGYTAYLQKNTNTVESHQLKVPNIYKTKEHI